MNDQIRSIVITIIMVIFIMLLLLLLLGHSKQPTVTFLMGLFFLGYQLSIANIKSNNMASSRAYIKYCMANGILTHIKFLHRAKQYEKCVAHTFKSHWAFIGWHGEERGKDTEESPL